MEMESSRRPSFDRSRELGLKRPRIAEEPSLNNRAFQQKQQRPANSGTVASAAAAASRLRLNNDRDRDSDEPVRGSYQQPTPLQQHQELINQYKTALAELTFNSKPIITNLTIIAGENTNAAKSIAATICANILEVPSDQKLPSLYLLDSIVKNIGRDYIKYFAAKLPEVFCKAYGQVDPPVHTSMRHLFGTWKGVFPLQTLQIIERELGFAAAANGSSSSTPRADSQTQRQPHSIHVNPKYLEARRLQQSNRNVQQPQRDDLRESGLEKPLVAEFEDHEYGSGLSRNITSRLGKPNERITDHPYDKQWPSAGRVVEESISNPRNGVNARKSTPSLMASRSANMHLLPPHNVASRSGRELPRSWKNSEEEEFMWDDLNPGVADHVAVDNIQKDHWTGDGLDKLGSRADIGSRIDRETDTLPIEQVPFGRQRSSSWQLQEQLLVQGSDIPHSRTGLQSHASASAFGLSNIPGSVPSGSLGQRLPSSGKPLISQLSKRDPRLNFVEKEQAQANPLAQPNRKPAPLSRSSDLGAHNPKHNDSFLGVHQNLNLDNIKKSEPQSFQKTTSSVASLRSKQLGSSSGTSNAIAGDSTGGQLDAGALLAAVMKSGVPLGPLADGGQPSLPIGPSQTSLSGPRSTSSSGSPDLVSLLSKIKTEELPISPPSSDGPTSSSNPFSSLINSLMAKGLIVASKTESETLASPPLSSKSNNQSPTIITELPSVSVSSVILSSTADNKLTSSVSVPSVIPSPTSKKHPSSVSVPSVIPSSTSKKPVIPSSNAKRLTSSKPSQVAPQTIKPKVEDLIGFEFRLDLLRQLHPPVVDGLFEDLPHSCSICGLRLKLKERLDRHLEWHALKKSEPDKSSRKWYANPEDWVAGKETSNFGSNIVKSSQESEKDPEPMVPADESHCVCLLCGELFEDFYSLERDEWMFKGAVYMTISSENGSWGTSSQNCGNGIIVHEKCMADDSVHDLEQAKLAKMGKKV